MAGNELLDIRALGDARAQGDALRRATENAGEYARVYLMAKSRQRGCDGMGEFHALKEEFREAVTIMFEISGSTTQADDDALERIAAELAEMQPDSQ